jgi:hypothetical protein
MRDGNGGSHGIPGNEQSVSCRAPEGLTGSNPTLTAITKSIKLLAFCKSKGYIRMSQPSVSAMELFYHSWPDGIRARAKKLERLRAFVKFCLKRKWLAENLIEDLETRSDPRPQRIACPSRTRNCRRFTMPARVWGKFVGRAVLARESGWATT